MEKNIKVYWSASEMEPWTSEITIINFDISGCKLTCKSDDNRIGKKINIPADMEYYTNDGRYIIYRGYEMVAYVKYNEVIKNYMDLEKSYYSYGKY